MKDAAQDVAEDLAEDVPHDAAQDLAFGAWAARALLTTRHATSVAAAVFVQLVLRWRRNWAAQWHLARAAGCGQALPGVPRKAPLCLFLFRDQGLRATS